VTLGAAENRFGTASVLRVPGPLERSALRAAHAGFGKLRGERPP
jgi:hypothetical protein